MIITFVVIFALVLIAVFAALRLPALKIKPGLSQAQKLASLDRWLARAHAAHKFNGVVLLARQGEVIFNDAYGDDAASPPHPLDEHASFNLASVSKQFTAAGILLLCQQKRLSVQDKLSQHIPELDFYDDIRVEQLLQHTSGLPDYMALVLKKRKRQDTLSSAELIELFCQHKPPLRFRPGRKFQYSNTGYVLLAEIIARVSGSSFEEFMARHIFEPLHMQDSQVFNLFSRHPPKRRVFGFKRRFGLFGGARRPRDLNHFDGVAGDGAVYSSAHDLNRWHRALCDGCLLPDELLKAAYTPATLPGGKSSGYGYGWFINPDGSVEHAGGWQGFTSYIYRHLHRDELIVILDNGSNVLRVNSYGFRWNSIGKNLKHFMQQL